MKYCEIVEKREMNIYKRNDLIQRSRYRLTLNQQKILGYLISKIQPYDSPDKVYTLSIKDYCDTLGIQSVDRYYTVIKDDLQAIANASAWIYQPNGDYSLIHWLDIANISEGSGTITIVFSRSIRPYLFFSPQQGFFTKYPFLFLLPMKNKYSIRLYELLKSYANTGEMMAGIQNLKQTIDAESEYEKFYDFKRYVIDKAIDEINKYTDLIITLTQIKQGKQTIALRFIIERKNGIEIAAIKHEDHKKLAAPRKSKPKVKTNLEEAISQNQQALDEVYKIIESGKLDSMSEQYMKKIQYILDRVEENIDRIDSERSYKTSLSTSEEAADLDLPV